MHKKLKELPCEKQDIDKLLQNEPDPLKEYGENIGIFLSLSVISWLISLVLALFIEAIFSLDWRWSFREEAIAATIISVIPIGLLYKTLQKDNKREKMKRK